jgi:hypothetical protein
VNLPTVFNSGKVLAPTAFFALGIRLRMSMKQLSDGVEVSGEVVRPVLILTSGRSGFVSYRITWLRLFTRSQVKGWRV